MEKVCSWKTVGAIFLLFLVLFTANVIAAPAGIGPTEAMIRDLWMSDKDKRPEAELLYWSEIRRQVDSVQDQLPILVNPYQAVVGVKLIGKTVTYEYAVSPDVPDNVFEELHERIRKNVCNGDGGKLFFHIMGGSKIFAYYRPGTQVPYMLFSVAPSNCEDTTI